MKSMLGHGASSCSYADWIGADLIIFFGANTPNNQPVTAQVSAPRQTARHPHRRRQHV
jgi:anaerobic selenocysteine-containing dehydrogenase